MKNNHQNLSVIVLAAGKGKRMKSEKPKVLHQICFEPIIYHVLKAVEKINPKNVFVVVGYKGKTVEDYLKSSFPSARVVYQEEQLGTAHAVKTAKKFASDFARNCMVLVGDIPLITHKTIEKTVNEKEKSKNAATLVTSIVNNPTGYGRVIKDCSGNIIKIVEESDATDKEKKINEINSSIYCFNTELLFEYLDRIRPDNSQNEYYLTDIIASLVADGKNVNCITAPDTMEVEGINDRKKLALLEKIMFQDINSKFMLDGVTFRNPDTSRVGSDVKIARDTIIEMGCSISGKTKIGSECIIGPFSQIEDSIIGDNSRINRSIIQGSTIGDFKVIGPNNFIKNDTILVNTTAGQSKKPEKEM